MKPRSLRGAEHGGDREQREQHDREVRRRAELDDDVGHASARAAPAAAVPIVPATNEPIAAVASAWAARPALAILLPSIAVTTEEDSPGVLSRIEVVDPPYMPP